MEKEYEYTSDAHRMNASPEHVSRKPTFDSVIKRLEMIADGAAKNRGASGLIADMVFGRSPEINSEISSDKKSEVAFLFQIESILDCVEESLRRTDHNLSRFD